MSLNTVILQGNILHDLELKGSEGKEVVNFLIGVNRNYKREGEQYPKSDTIPVKAFGERAKFICNHFKKRDQIIVAGSIELEDPFKNSSGVEISNQLTVKISEVYFAGHKPNEDNAVKSTQKMTPAQPENPPFTPTKPARTTSPFAKK